MSFKGWEKTEIAIDSGEKTAATAPLIVSASRETDIPAFYAEWFMHRLDKGYLRWTNPFNGVPQYVSFEKTRLIVFWTKNPAPLFPYLARLEKKGIGFYVQVTLNDYENEHFEPHVPSIDKRIESFVALSKRIGKERVLWRFDPLILSDKTGTGDLLRKVAAVGEKVHKHTDRLTISFCAHYAKVRRRMKSAGIAIREFTGEEIRTVAEGLGKYAREWGIKAVTCAHEHDLSAYGIDRGKCIDDALIVRLFSDDPILMRFLGVEQPVRGPVTAGKNLKDPGQRRFCGCIASKDIGKYDSCPHLCVYCYANGPEAKMRYEL
jgi:DNA repair photolyase